MTALSRRKLVLLRGSSGFGKRSAALVALSVTGHRPILEISSNYSFKNIRTSVLQLVRQHPGAGILVTDLGSATLDEISDFRAQSMSQMLMTGEVGAALVITSEETPIASEHLCVIEAEAPSTAEVIEFLFRGNEDAVLAGAKTRAEQLIATSDVKGFAQIETLVTLIQRHAGESDAAILDKFLHRSGHGLLEEWLRKKPPLGDYAVLLATAACEYSSYSDVMEYADLLCSIYRGDRSDEAADTDVMYRAVDEQALVRTRLESRYTHFGQHAEEVIFLRDPLAAD